MVAVVVGALAAIPAGTCLAQPDAGAAADSLAADSLAAAPVAPDSAQRAGDGRAAVPRNAPELAGHLVEEGLENVRVDRAESTTVVRFENRRYRHTSTALGIIARHAGGPTVAYEQRLGLIAAAIPDSGTGVAPHRVMYPSDREFPRPARGAVEASTRRSLDLLFEPLFHYELGGILTPVRGRTDLQSELSYNPWPGGHLRAALVIPIHNDFKDDVDPDHPDVDNLRPGPLGLEQFGWSPGAALFSGTAGLLGNNRYGLSVGIARPLQNGQFLIDAQSDLTGFIAFNDSSVAYSTLDRWSGFAGVTYRPPRLDLGVRLRAERFIYGDQGMELEVRREMGDFDVAFVVQRIQGFNIGGVRLGLPLPPLARPVGWPVRVLPVQRFPFSYREESGGAGRSLENVASREDYLRQLDGPALENNAYRYERAREGARSRRAAAGPQWVSLAGMTGFVNTPWAGVLGDRSIELGYNRIPKEAAYQQRGLHPNELYYATLGFLPHVEVGLRWTVIPGYHPFRYLVPESPYVDADRMLSGRIEILPPRSGHLGFAIGGEDMRGTRKFHSTYGVFGLPFDIYHLQNRVTLGYAPRVFTASRRTLDGLFGAYEVAAWRSVALALEQDTEKWNSMLGINLGLGFRARVALLDLKHLSIGAGWFRAP